MINIANIYKDMKKSILLIVFVIAAICTGVYTYLYRGHRDVAATAATSRFTSSALLAIFQDTDILNDKQALDQVIAVTGRVTAQQDSLLTLDNIVFVQMQQFVRLTANEEVTIKGRCMGYDELLGEIKIDQATIEQ